MHNLDILLINPPFSMPDKPCISIPVLAGYLKQKGFQVEGLDLNNLFYHRLLSAENLTQSMAFVRERFPELNNQSSLALFEMKEYLSLYYLIQTVFPRLEELKNLYKNRERRNTESFLLFEYAAKLAGAPFFPESLEFTLNTGYVRYRSPFHKFSSYDIYNSLFSNSMYEGMLNELLKQRIIDQDTLAVGLSVSFPDQVLPAFKCARIIKGLRPDIHITVGGSFISVHMRQFEEKRLFHFVDSIILDDGEHALELLLGELTRKADKGFDIPGIMYLKENSIITIPPAPPAQSYNIPMPDYAIFPLDEYLIKNKRMALLFRLSRGCYWAKCAFCRTQHSIIKDYRQPDSQFLYNNLKSIVALTGISIYHFTDDAAAPDVLEAISKQIRKDNLSIGWVVNLRFSPELTTQRLRHYREGGCRHIYFGLESFTPRVLRLMKKGISFKQVESCLKRCAEIGIPVTVYMIVGFPTETEAEARDSFKKILQFKERGLIKNCVYNIFEMVNHSAISADPKRYTIENLDRASHLDLAPPITQFESAGMSRERAKELCNEFIYKLKDLGDLMLFCQELYYQNSQDNPINLSINLSDSTTQEIPINFNMQEIRQHLLHMDTVDANLSKAGLNKRTTDLLEARVYREGI